MPHFTTPLDPVRGPVVNAGIGVSEGRRAALIAANQAVPAPQYVRGLIDTGASFTSVDPIILANLGLTPTGTIDIVTPSTGQGVHTTDTYDVDFSLGTNSTGSSFSNSKSTDRLSGTVSYAGDSHAYRSRYIVTLHICVQWDDWTFYFGLLVFFRRALAAFGATWSALPMVTKTTVLQTGC